MHKRRERLGGAVSSVKKALAREAALFLEERCIEAQDDHVRIKGTRSKESRPNDLAFSYRIRQLLR